MVVGDKSRGLRDATHGTGFIWLAPVMVFGATLCLIFFVGNLGWDDGAITLAFARTLAHSGRIALTPVSETVEGFSTPLWFFLLAAMERVTDFDFSSFVRSSQIGAALCTALAAAVFYRLLDFRLSRWFRIAAALLLGLSCPFLNEAVNGMEMALFALMTALVLLAIRENRSVLLVIAVALATATRFEAVFYFLAASAFLWLLGAKNGRKTAVLTVVSSMASFLIFEIWRILWFKLWIPNTIQAKRWPPYSNSSLHQAWSLRALGLIELPILFAIPLLWLGFHLFRNRSNLLLKRNEINDDNGMYLFAGGYVVGVVFFSTLAGHNIGYLGRMQISAFIPLLVLLLHVARSILRPFPERIAVLVLLLWWATDLRALRMEPIQLSLRDRHLLQQGPRMLQAREPANWDGTTPQNYATTGVAVDALRRTLGLKTLVFATPDVGGSALCCEHLRIVDSALLTNQELAGKGYSKAAALFEREDPEVIETHSIWAKLNGFYTMPFFQNNYVPATFLGNYFWMRKDVVRQLLSGQEPKYLPCAEVYREGLRYFEQYEPTDPLDDLQACTQLAGKVIMLPSSGPRNMQP